jgi:hypothetical protein
MFQGYLHRDGIFRIFVDEHDARVSTATALALQRLARRGEVTQRSVIEELVLAADEQAAAGLTEEEWAEYFSVTR